VHGLAGKFGAWRLRYPRILSVPGCTVPSEIPEERRFVLVAVIRKEYWQSNIVPGQIGFGLGRRT
jgi:hypothetical protein